MRTDIEKLAFIHRFSRSGATRISNRAPGTEARTTLDPTPPPGPLALHSSTSATVLAGFYSLTSTFPTAGRNPLYTCWEQSVTGRNCGGSHLFSHPS